MNRRVIVLFHESLGNENRVFKVVTTPGHESHEHVTTQCQLTTVSTRSVRYYLPLRDPLANVNNRTLVDAGVLVRPLELDEGVESAVTSREIVPSTL